MTKIDSILDPLIAKSMRVKGYSRNEAENRAQAWLASELRVSSLTDLDFEQTWCAEAIVEKALLPPPGKRKRKIEIPKEVQQYFTYSEPLGEAYWSQLRELWGEEFFALFFGERRTSTALLSPGQKAQQEWNSQELILA